MPSSTASARSPARPTTSTFARFAKSRVSCGILTPALHRRIASLAPPPIHALLRSLPLHDAGEHFFVADLRPASALLRSFPFPACTCRLSRRSLNSRDL